MIYKKGDKVICRNTPGVVVSFDKKTGYYKVKSDKTNTIMPLVNTNELKLSEENSVPPVLSPAPVSSKILDEIMGAEEASKLWNLSPSYIKDLCAKNAIKCKKIGKTWVIDKTQPNPSKSSE